jgi:hypothetical protein
MQIFFGCMLFANIPIVDRERLKMVADDMPLARPDDKEAWNYLFELLQNIDQAELDKIKTTSQNHSSQIDSITNHKTGEITTCEIVGFTELDQQPAEYRGRLVRISGRLIRCEKKRNYYESWVLVNDKKNIPICVCSLEIPPEAARYIIASFNSASLNQQPNTTTPPNNIVAQNNQYNQDGIIPRQNQINVTTTGFFYKRQLCISNKNEEFTAPTILTKSLSISKTTEKINTTQTNQDTFFSFEFTFTVVLIFLAWIICRFYFSFRHKRFLLAQRKFLESGENNFDKININNNNDTNNNSTNQHEDNISQIRIVTILLLFVTIICCNFTPKIIGQETKTFIDSKLTQTLLDIDADQWNSIGDDNNSLDDFREEILLLIERLNTIVSPLILRDSTTAMFSDKQTLPPDLQLRQLVIEPENYRGKSFLLKGFLRKIQQIPLTQSEQKICGTAYLNLALFEIPNQGAVLVLTPFVPPQLADLTRQNKIDHKIIDTELTGIYIKRIPLTNQTKIFGNQLNNVQNENKKIHQNNSGDSDLRVEYLPLLVSCRIRWFPQWSFLGSLGFDVGGFEFVPSLSISDLRRDDLPVSPVIAHLSRAEIVRRAFKFTEFDREPFYRLLNVAQKKPESVTKLTNSKNQNKTAQLDIKQKSFPVAELFNNIAGVRGKPVLLHGVAKRINQVLVDDKEVKELYGIERYYQIFLYTGDSREFPLVICVDSLPEGMLTGSARDYNESMSVTAIPYKLWVYETQSDSNIDIDADAGADADAAEQNRSRPIAVPLLIGQEIQWYPKKNNNITAKYIYRTISICATLILVWILLKFILSAKKSK